MSERKFRITFELTYDDAPPTTPEEVRQIAANCEDALADRFWSGSDLRGIGDVYLRGEGRIVLAEVEEEVPRG